MPSTLTPNMSLIVPTIGTEPGPDWAQDQNTDLTLLDQHDHGPGKGVQVTPAGLNISSDLTFNSNDATNLRSARFNDQLVPLSAGTDVRAIYSVLGDLYYNDSAGTPIRLTAFGNIVGTIGNISGLLPPASVNYVSATPAYVFQSDVNIPADLDGGSLVLRNITAGSNGITLSAPAALAADYTLTLPGALPASTKIVRLDNSGNISATLGTDNTTIEVNSNNLRVVPGGITNTQLGAGAALDNIGLLGVTTAYIDDGAVTDAKLAPASIFDNTFLAGSTNVNATIVTVSINNPNARPVIISLSGVFGGFDGGIPNPTFLLRVTGGSLGTRDYGYHANGQTGAFAVGMFAPFPTVIDAFPPAGVSLYTFTAVPGGVFVIQWTAGHATIGILH